VRTSREEEHAHCTPRNESNNARFAMGLRLHNAKDYPCTLCIFSEAPPAMDEISEQIAQPHLGLSETSPLARDGHANNDATHAPQTGWPV